MGGLSDYEYKGTITTSATVEAPYLWNGVGLVDTFIEGEPKGEPKGEESELCIATKHLWV